MLSLSASQISAAIRAKKKKLMESEPSLIDTSPTPDMNAQDVEDMKQHGRIEDTLESSPKSNADKTMADESYQGVGLSPMEMGRMERLRKYFDMMDL